MTKIILIAGQIGSGKGYISSKKSAELKEVGNTILHLSFANPIKKIIDGICGFDKNLKQLETRTETSNLTIDDFVTIIKESINDFVLDEINDFHQTSGLKLEEFDDAQDEIVNELYELYHIVSNIEQLPQTRKNAIRKMYQLFGTELCQPINKTIWALYLSARISNCCYETDIDYVIVDDFRFIMEFFSMLSLLPNYEIIPYAIIADKKVRAKRRGISISELNEMCNHLSEREFELILSWMKMRLPENIIENN